jgi:hypothetical protein
MCFSANVSYVSAALLIATGTATTLGSSKPQKMVAAIPLLFGIQQASEGIVWQTLGQDPPSSWHQLGVLMFLTFANVIWPTWLPWSFYKIEPNEKRKRILRALGVMGLGVSLLAAWMLYTANVTAYVNGHSMGYGLGNFKRYWPSNIEFVLYFSPTMLPFFVSSLRTVKRAGYLVLGSWALAQIINQETTTSVWCFFAALISLYIAVNVLWLQRGKLS